MRFILYTRPGCHLCEVLEDQVKGLPSALLDRLPELEVVDISGEPELEEAFGLLVPVLMLEGRMAARGRVSDRVLHRRIRELLVDVPGDRSG